MAYRKAYRRTQREVDASRKLVRNTETLKSNTAELVQSRQDRYATMSYRDVQSLASSYGIPGKQTRAALIAAIEDYLQ